MFKDFFFGTTAPSGPEYLYYRDHAITLRRTVHGTIRTVNTTHTAALKTTTRPKTRCRKPYAATQHLMLLMMGVCARNMSSSVYINKITLLHQVGIPHYFIVGRVEEDIAQCSLSVYMKCHKTLCLSKHIKFSWLSDTWSRFSTAAQSYVLQGETQYF